MLAIVGPFPVRDARALRQLRTGCGDEVQESRPCRSFAPDFGAPVGAIRFGDVRELINVAFARSGAMTSGRVSGLLVEARCKSSDKRSQR
jgi:hypothetical protein